MSPRGALLLAVRTETHGSHLGVQGQRASALCGIHAACVCCGGVRPLLHTPACAQPASTNGAAADCHCLMLLQGVRQAAVQSGPSCMLNAPGRDRERGWQPTPGRTGGRRQLPQPQAQVARPTSPHSKTAAKCSHQLQQAQAGGGYACRSSSRSSWAAAPGCLQGWPSFGVGCKSGLHSGLWWFLLLGRAELDIVLLGVEGMDILCRPSWDNKACGACW